MRSKLYLGTAASKACLRSAIRSSASSKPTEILEVLSLHKKTFVTLTVGYSDTFANIEPHLMRFSVTPRAILSFSSTEACVME